MPNSAGKSGKPGNDTAYRNIGIRTSNPGRLQPTGTKKANMSVSEVFSKKADKSSGSKGAMNPKNKSY